MNVDPSMLDDPTIGLVGRLLDGGRPAHAEIVLRRIARTEPEQDLRHLRLRVAQARQDLVGMIPAIDDLIGTAPAPPALLLAKARASYVLGRLEEGLAAIDGISIPAGHPQAGQVAWWKGRMLIRAGRLDEARATAQGLALRPRMRAMAEVQLAEISMLEGDLESACEQLSELLDGEGPVGPRFDAAFLLARGLDRLGRHEEAFEAAATGNRLHPRTFDAKAWERATDRIIADDDSDRVRDADHGRSEATPVLILGMPRSGTSLLEQIIASHPDGGGVGERREPMLIHEDLEAIRDLHGREPTDEDLELEAGRYLAMHDFMGAGERCVANKVLGLERVLGSTAAILPGARVIHLDRDPRDTLLSIHQHPLNLTHHPWAGDLEDLIVARSTFDRLAGHWQDRFAERMIRVSYEDLVRNPEPQIRRILAFLDLPFDDACLRFHELHRTVITPSHDQVREPLNTRGIGRWRRYGSLVAPLEAAFPDDPADQPRP